MFASIISHMATWVLAGSRVVSTGNPLSTRPGPSLTPSRSCVAPVVIPARAFEREFDAAMHPGFLIQVA